jgi:nucleoside-diphosphate-sugar epimerase
MQVLVVGAAGMLGRKLGQALALAGSLGDEPVERLTLADASATPTGAEPPTARCAVETVVADIAMPGAAQRLVAGRPEVIFHLAAVVSGEAEIDVEKGYRVNLDGTRLLFDAIRTIGDGYRPRVVYTSSIAVFGAPFPERIDDDFILQPLTSYGAQKAIGELLLTDYSRRGFLDGIGLRLPTICIRPGTPNRAASGFFSSIIREPLEGREAVLPVPRDVRHWFASPRSAVRSLTHAATLDTGRLGARRCLTMPGLAATVGEAIEALRRVAGDAAVGLIRDEPDESIMRIVAGWPSDFSTMRAHDLGFRAETSFDQIIRVHLEDELAGRLVGLPA